MSTRKPEGYVRAALHRQGIDLTGDELKPAVDAYVDISGKLEGLRAVLDAADGEPDGYR